MPNMTLDQNHAAMVAALVKPGEEIIEQTTPIHAHLNHMAMLLAGETGELVDAIKKHTIYGKDLDFVNVIEELGDIEFALEAIRKSLEIHRDEALAMNMEKLMKRYPEGKFSNADAQARADKVEEEGDAHKQIPLPINSVVSDGFKGEASEFKQGDTHE